MTSPAPKERTNSKTRDDVAYRDAPTKQPRLFDQRQRHYSDGQSFSFPQSVIKSLSEGNNWELSTWDLTKDHSKSLGLINYLSDLLP